MTVLHLTSPVEIIKNWDAFREGLQQVNTLTGEKMSEDTFCKLLVNLSSRGDSSWIGLACQGGPLSYAVMVDSTPPHADERTFLCVAFYAVPGSSEATVALQRAFEKWAREHDVLSYVVTTRRHTGGAFKCFWSGKYGFKRGYFAFEKTL